MNNIEGFLKQAEEEAGKLPLNEREEQLARIHEMWINYRGDDEIVSSHELMELMKGEPEIPKIMTMWGGLNNHTGGFRYGQLVILSAQEKSGKTSFALQMIEDFIEPTCFLFEQNAREIITQMQERGQKIPYFLTPKINIDNRWEWIEKKMLEAMVKRGSRIFVIDNVDWIQKEYRDNLRSDEVIRDLLLAIKAFCKQWEVIIFLVAHVKKIPFEQIPQPDDIKDTAAFKQIADIVLILWRKTLDEKVSGTKTKAKIRTNDTLLWVAENRATGKTGYTQLNFDGRRFVEKIWDVNLETNEAFYDDRTF